MTAPVCAECDRWIETSNRSFPGFCSPECSDVDRQRRDWAASDLAQRRADARQHRAATDRTRRTYYLT